MERVVGVFGVVVSTFVVVVKEIKASLLFNLSSSYASFEKIFSHSYIGERDIHTIRSAAVVQVEVRRRRGRTSCCCYCAFDEWMKGWWLLVLFV